MTTTQTQDQPLAARLDRAVQVATGGGFWGAILVAKADAILLAKGYGFADYQDKPVTADTLFEIASTSKQFTAVAILTLVAEGALKLDTTLGDLFPGAPADKKPLTVHQLLTHTSGLSPQAGVAYAWPGDRGAYIAEVLRAPLASKPGTTFAYANAGYAILAAVIEVASKQTFESYLAQKVFAPAGLEDTGCIGDERLQRSSKSSVRLPDCRAAADWHWGFGYRGMGGVVTTARDLWRWTQALRGDKLLDKQTKAAFYETVRDDYACGIYVTLTDRGTRRASHSGGVQGYRCALSDFLDEGIAIVVLSNDRCEVHRVEQALLEVLFPRPRIEATIDVAGYELGEYRQVELGDQVELTATGKGETIEVGVVDTARKHAVATVRVPRAMAPALARRLLLARAAPKPQGNHTNKPGIYLGGYAAGTTRLELRDELELEVLPHYRGRGENGLLCDPRVTFVLMDHRAHFWPVMVPLSDADAEALAVDLQRAARDC